MTSLCVDPTWLDVEDLLDTDWHLSAFHTVICEEYGLYFIGMLLTDEIYKLYL